ncbi:hypothetical protein BB558_001205 [Smittium angustum]|uniref:Uncharacterized protein n=1 Tax=Smittium angustum TaxID=133377 RepID=A0A2U1JC14_SMIAN|nr:hypothetical protein BB558_001205 [Smittium angustum]
MDPSKSWIGRWNHLSKYKVYYVDMSFGFYIDTYSPGIYASHVSGRIPEDVEDDLSQRGIVYHPRDGTEIE